MSDPRVNIGTREIWFTIRSARTGIIAMGEGGHQVTLHLYDLSQGMARAMSFWPAVTWNWLMNRTTTFGDRERRPKARQWLEFVMTSGVGFTFSYGTYLGLTANLEFFDKYRLLAFVAGVGAAATVQGPAIDLGRPGSLPCI